MVLCFILKAFYDLIDMYCGEQLDKQKQNKKANVKITE